MTCIMHTYIEDIDVNRTELYEIDGVNLMETLIFHPNKARRRSKQIGNLIKKEVSENKVSKSVRVLVLGSGDSGKSTFVRQLRISHEKLFTLEELELLKYVIHNNIFSELLILINSLPRLSLKLKPNNEFLESAAIIKNYSQHTNYHFEKKLPSEVINTFIKIWNDPDIKECFCRRCELQDSFQETMT
ncbi:hypothetical protein HDU92_008706 [Lobulomyces angularis]|nr:hypothetical protein HDU92_008706 [Lobulomyces angularis]